MNVSLVWRNICVSASHLFKTLTYSVMFVQFNKDTTIDIIIPPN